MKLNATTVSVRSAKPTYAFGEVARTPLDTGSAIALVRAAIPADIPDNAVVTRAQLVFRTRGNMTGSRSVTAQRLAAGFAVSKANWNNKPGVTGTAHAVTLGAIAGGTEFRIDVSADAQLFIAGTATNYGWRLTTSDTAGIAVTGSASSTAKPFLDLEYVSPSDSPVSLSPDGAAVSVAKPTLTATVPDETIAIQVQLDAVADAVSPDFDSGEVTATAGLLDLATTAYAGLALGATTSWRIRAKNALGWSAWSDWATFSRVAKTTVTVTAPASTTGDPTPPITWAAAGQTAWRVLVYNDATGALLDDSKTQAGTDTDWTPRKGLKKVGEHARIVVRVWDAVERVQTPGDPTYAETTFVTQLVANSAAPGVSKLTATMGHLPYVRLAWEGVDADQWQIVRDGKWYDRIDGAARVWYDYLAKPRQQYAYRVLPVGDTGVGALGPTATVKPRPPGLWLFDETETIFVVDHEMDVTWAEQAVEHEVINGPVVRRRVGMPPPRGTVVGTLVDGTIGDCADFVATALSFKASDQGRVYRLVYGDRNIPVTIGNLMVEPDDIHPDVYEISFAWWQTDDELPWDA